MIISYINRNFELDRFVFLYNLLIRNSKILDYKFYDIISRSSNINEDIIVKYYFINWNYYLLSSNYI